MISARLFDHTVTVYGSQDIRGATFGDVARAWSPVPGSVDVRIAIQTRREERKDSGPGERVDGEHQGFGHASLDIVEGDVVMVTAGSEASGDPDKPKLLKVQSAYRPRGHHTQLVLTDWSGVL
jgi:hypothetical protein